jgi:Flp pilus assembly protein TadD
VTRPDRAKLLVLVSLLGLTGLTIAGLAPLESAERVPVLVLVVVALLTPSQVQARLLKLHAQGRRAHRAGRHTEALRLYGEQLAAIQQRPQLNHAVRLGRMLYTDRTDAMVWNSIAALCLELGRADQARSAAENALAFDPLYPLPWVTLAGSALLEDDRLSAERCLQQAHALGFRGASIAALSQQTAAARSRIEADREIPPPTQ